MSFLFNKQQKFSSSMKLLHWTIFILILLQFYLVYYSHEFFPKGSPERIKYILLHKSFGMSLLVIAFLMLLAKHLGKRPLWPKEMPKYERFLAKTVHIGLYLVLIFMPLTGYLMAGYAGYTVSVFGCFDLPNFVAKAPETGKMMYGYHKLLVQALYVLVGLHFIGALKHHFIDKNNILKRMLPLC